MNGSNYWSQRVNFISWVVRETDQMPINLCYAANREGLECNYCTA
jgi:hypothetical protein